MLAPRVGHQDSLQAGFRSILDGAVTAWVSFRSTVEGLQKDHAMTALHVDATPITGYTTLLDATRAAMARPRSARRHLLVPPQRMDYTGPSVYRGLAGFHLIRDDIEDALTLRRGGREVPGIETSGWRTCSVMSCWSMGHFQLSASRST
jgi:hypothetical protein